MAYNSEKMPTTAAMLTLSMLPTIEKMNGFTELSPEIPKVPPSQERLSFLVVCLESLNALESMPN